MDGTALLKRFEADIDLKRTVAIRPFTVVEGDTGNSVTLGVYDGSEAVDLTGCTAAAVFSHSKGISEQDTEDGSVTIDGNELTLELRPSSFAPGMVECEVQIYSGGNGIASRDTLVTTAKFNFTCRRAILNADSIESVPQFPLLTGLIRDVTEAEAARAAAETARQAAETARQSAEAQRAIAETARASAEAQRVSAENARNAAELLRESKTQAAIAAADAATQNANAAAALIGSGDADTVLGFDAGGEPIGVPLAELFPRGEKDPLYVKQLVRANRHTGIEVGTEFIAQSLTAGEMVLAAAGHDAFCGQDEKSLVLKTKEIVALLPFSQPQLLIYAETGLAPGYYRFTISHGAYNESTGQDGTYIFKLNQAVPAGGGIRHSTAGASQTGGYTKAQITGGTVTTYGAQPERAAIESGVTVYEWDGTSECTDLGTVTAADVQYAANVSGFTKVNYTQRNAAGSNRYAHSCLRKWLNSAGRAVLTGDSTFSYWWTPSNEFDMPPADSVRKAAGFLYGMEPSLVSALGEASVITELPAPERSEGRGTTETLNDRVFAFSKTEFYGGTNITLAEGALLPIYEGEADSARIHCQGTTANKCWLRSAYPGKGSIMRIVQNNGSVGNGVAYGNYGVVAGMVIKA